MGIATRLLVFVIAATVLVGPPAARAAEEVDLLLVLSSDVSRSIDARKFKLQREGYAAAIVNPRVLQAIRSGALGQIAVSLVEWSGVGAQKIVIDWTVIRDDATAKDFSAQVIEAPRAFADRTSISGGIDFAMAQLARAPFQSNRRTIDVSGDGTNNSGRDVTDARDEAVAKGVTINGLVILSERPMSWNADHTNPPSGLDAYYRNNVIGGPGSFVMVAEDFSSFGQTILNKLNAEIAPKGTKADTGAKDAGAMSKQQLDKLPRPVTPPSLRVPHRSPGYSDWLTGDGYQKLVEAMVQQRRYPRVVEARAFNGILLYHAAFAPYPAGTFNFWSHYGLTSDDFAQKDRLHRRDGHRLTHKQSVHLDGREFIQATWVRP
jgi:hypothetical protein